MYRSTDQLLVVAKTADVRRRGDESSTVHIGGVQEVDSEIDRRSDRLYGLTVIGGSVELRHSHAAQADGAHGQLGMPEPHTS